MKTLPVKKVLVVDDDDVFCTALKKSLKRRGYETQVAYNSDQAILVAEQFTPNYAVIDLRIGNESGLLLLNKLTAKIPMIHAIILTGYASISTAVEAIKLGAVHYLTKPASPDEIINAFSQCEGNEHVELSERPLSLGRLEWEHINKVVEQNNGNISAAARALGMHRRSLQRKLQRYPVKE